MRGTVGFIDIRNPARPLADGTITLDPDPADDTDVLADVDGRPRQPLRAGHGRHQRVEGRARAVSCWSSTSPAARSSPTIDLGGQPDSAKISPDHRFLAIAIENERDEEVDVDGVEGGLPQAPAGLPRGDPAAGPAVELAPAGRVAHRAGRALYPDDPEPEFVDINQANQAVVTLQENNHIVVVDLPSRQVVKHFPAGAVTLTGVDADRRPGHRADRDG